jgi:DMSO reductase anchor subunit
LVLLAVPIGLSGLYFMHMIYRIKARPFWNHWQVLTSFFGNMLSLGAIIIGLFCVPMAWFSSVELGSLLIDLAPFVALGLLLEVIGHYCHFRDLSRWGREGAASLGVLRSEFGKTHRARNYTLLTCLVISVAVSLAPAGLVAPSAFMNILLAGVAIASLGAAIVSRALFYVLVIPTTMPGAFFWKNKGFEEHARETGLAKMPQVGVVEFDH